MEQQTIPIMVVIEGNEGWGRTIQVDLPEGTVDVDSLVQLNDGERIVSVRRLDKNNNAGGAN
jgi:hypothetical protein